MHRFFLPPEQCRGESCILTESDAHHARQVLRVNPGDRVAVLDGAGHELLCQVEDTGHHAVRVAVRQRNTLPPLPFSVTLVQAVTKARSMEFIVQKATELGVAQLVPVLSERSVPHWEGEHATHKVEKWQTIAIESIKQCGSPWLPKIAEPQSPAVYLARAPKQDLVFLASLQPGAQHPGGYLRTFQQEQGRPARAVTVWVGPEGDFTPAELNSIRAAGALPITLGPLVLRSETAALYCLSFLSYELQGQA